jgi:hypothetical protein
VPSATRAEREDLAHVGAAVIAKRDVLVGEEAQRRAGHRASERGVGDRDAAVAQGGEHHQIDRGASEATDRRARDRTHAAGEVSKRVHACCMSRRRATGWTTRLRGVGVPRCVERLTATVTYKVRRSMIAGC